MDDSDENRIARIEAAVLRRLLEHLRARNDVQNIELMILAGFCRNCLADWYQEAAASEGIAVDREAARERIHGEPYTDWKARHERPATEEQLAALAAARARKS